jgi:hypothetical protein
MQPVPESQTASAVLMIRPAHFRANPETADSNAFQTVAGAGAAVARHARAEFDALVKVLREAGVTVELFEDRAEPVSPDAVFPNNWVTFHADGRACLYPMLAQNRRSERRADILTALQKERGYRLTQVEDLSGAERDGRYLEGTGSLVLDRPHRVAYACLSPRTDVKLLADWSERMGYASLAFHARDAAGKLIYHTNVMLCIGDRFAVVCLDSIAERAERKRVETRLAETGHEVIAISLAEMQAFAGNMLQLASRDGGSVLAMSARAAAALSEAQRAALAKYSRIVANPIETIEDHSGGSVRCMLAEIFLPRI